MEKIKSKFCPALWFSGFFGLGAMAHLLRYLAGFQVIIAGREIPLNLSAVIAAVAGILSIALAALAMKRPCDRSG